MKNQIKKWAKKGFNMKIIKTVKYKQAQGSDPTYDPQNIDPDTNLPYGSPSLEDTAPNEHFTERGEEFDKGNEGRQYVSAYTVQKAYGGSEEGGWWYDVYELIDTIPVATRTAAEKVRKFLEEKYKNENEERGPLDSARGFEKLPEGTEDYQIPKGFTGDASEVRIIIEDTPGEMATKGRPHYE